jgi:hypothetical protein
MLRIVVIASIILAAFLPSLLSASDKRRRQLSDECPSLSVDCPFEVVELGVPVTFSAIITGSSLASNYTYHWTISAGTIISGQDTPTITVNRNGLEGGSLRATVEVSGFPTGCSVTASCTAQIFNVDCCRLFDIYGDIPFNKEKARLKEFALQLQREPGAIGQIIAYTRRPTDSEEAKVRAERARNYLIKKRGLEPERIIIKDGGYRDAEDTVELWVIPPGASYPP